MTRRKQIGYVLAFGALGWALAVLYGRYIDRSGPFHEFAITQGLMWVPVLLLLVARSLTREKHVPNPDEPTRPNPDELTREEVAEVWWATLWRFLIFYFLFLTAEIILSVLAILAVKAVHGKTIEAYHGIAVFLTEASMLIAIPFAGFFAMNGALKKRYKTFWLVPRRGEQYE